MSLFDISSVLLLGCADCSRSPSTPYTFGRDRSGDIPMLELNRISEIRKHARRVIEKYGITTPGTPLEKIMTGENLELVRRPWGRKNQTGGLLYRPERVIAINEDHPETRRRFST